MKSFISLVTLLLALCLAAPAAFAATPSAGSGQGRPNILMIMSDDVGITNRSAYSRGMAGYRSPNIDRIANEGALFTDYYAEQSCTAGRSTFITGQSPIRTGLTKVGFPGAAIGLQKEDPCFGKDTGQKLRNLQQFNSIYFFSTMAFQTFSA
jgi:hypothetical protein